MVLNPLKWLQSVYSGGKNRFNSASRELTISAIQKNFKNFLSLLDKNYLVLKKISDMEEKSQGEYLFDSRYIQKSLTDIREAMSDIIETLILFAGERYVPLRERFAIINAEVERVLPQERSVTKDAFTIPISELTQDRAPSVGSKNAQLGEMKSKLGLPVPEGFAISAWAYKHFVDSNDLQNRISNYISSLNIKCYNDLLYVSDQIQAMVRSSPIPDDLVQAIRESYHNLVRQSSPGKVAMRSSAIGEDTFFSFAGQHPTFLNVSEDQIIECYREVLTGKFSPNAIYYFLSHALIESELAMSVCCMTMIDAVASGVIYTRDPVNPDSDTLLINSVFGLGQYLVNGRVTPDTFRISRSNGAVIESHISDKPERLMICDKGGTVEEALPESERRLPSIEEKQLRSLTDMALLIEKHYGCPQDIEWALDREGRIFMLQTRPLQVVKERSQDQEELNISNLEVIMRGGTTVCPGAGGGRVFHVSSKADLARVPRNAVLITPHPSPALIAVMNRVGALVATAGGVAGHMATLAREYRIPTLVNVDRAEELPEGLLVTVDATEGVIYKGFQRKLICTRRSIYESSEDSPILSQLKQILSKISPLNLLDSSEMSFTSERCQTYHDIIRFAHQKSLEEMFSLAEGLEHDNGIGVRLKSEIPLTLNILYLDQDMMRYNEKPWITEDEIDSIPMKVFWEGLKEEGWPAEIKNVNVRGFMSVMMEHMARGERKDFLKSSFALLSREYMFLNIHMGYHFSTIEAMCTDDMNKNFIRIQYKEGGASFDRRARRVNLITEILSRMGFYNSSKGDFLDATISYYNPRAIAKKLRLLGRLTMMTKQLDMALNNDAIAEWYTQDFMKKLGIVN